MKQIFAMISALAICVIVPHDANAQILDRIFGQKNERSRPGQTYQSGGDKPTSQQAPYAAPGRMTQVDNRNQSQTVNSVAANRQSSRRILPAGTPVIMEFSDLQCPDSARYNNGLKQTVIQRYVANGGAVYQWHDFPLPNHAQAPEAAVAARCAGQSANRMRQMIMANQGRMSAEAYTRYARQLGVDSSEFNACIQNGNSMQQVMNDKALGQSMGVRGTPTLVLGTADGQGHVKPVKLVKAYDPPEQVLSEIDSFLAGVAPPQQPAHSQNAQPRQIQQ